jgi:CDP-diacylglycerol--glycerol-3-phosphate 3-phosphatidyltransferase
MFDGRWRHAVDRTTKPVGTVLVRAGVTADVLTIFGLTMSVVTAFVVGSGHLVVGVYLLFPTGLPDLFDGPVAKASGRASVRGAFFDSVADRISDAFLFGGVAWYLAARHHGEMVLLPFAILAVTSLISYQRAKAELLGLSAKGGLMERAERFILLGLCFIAGAVSASALVPALWVFFGLLSATAAGRFVSVWKEAEGPPRVAPLRPVFPSVGHGDHTDVSRRALARWREGRVDSRWRTWREARAQRDGAGVRVAVPRRAAQPSGRWRARRAGVPSSRSGRIWRARREARPASRSGRRPSSRGI